ncbi:MAG: hypothetical protein IJ568_01365 [Bacilli bacterium]|nr:hypothetical protein [Bacilli bacterium]
MIEIGDEFDFKGEIGIVCFKGNYYNQDYICIAFEKEGKFGIYKVKYEEDKYLVAEEKDKEKCAYVLSEFVTDDIIEHGEIDKLVELLKKNDE